MLLSQVDYSGRTALMFAALSGSDRCVALLLGYGADPNMTDNAGYTALAAAIMNGVNSTVGILAQVTTAQGFLTLCHLARYHQHVKFSKPLLNFVQKYTEVATTARLQLILGEACIYGATELFKIILESGNLRRNSLYDNFLPFLESAIMSDNLEICQAVLQISAVVPHTMISLARGRGNEDILALLTGVRENGNTKKMALKQAVMHKESNILDLVPAFVEFEYHNKTEMLLPLLKHSQEFVPFTTLLDKLLVKTVHYTVCPEECPQKAGCQRIRETCALVEILAKELEKKNPFYKGMSTKMVGSLSEKARVFHMDEVDFHFWFDEEMRHKISFDPNVQRARTEDSFYRKENNELDTEKLFFDFLLNIYEILPSLKVSPGMKLLSTDFTPCLRCMNTSGSRPETVRCRHKVECQAHDDSCNCKEFTSPSLTHTRSGAVLHLEWNEEGGAKFNIDVDLVPILPTSTPYNGEITDLTDTLAIERPMGWLGELDKAKVENMADAAYLSHLKTNQKWHLNLRLINRNVVMPRQVISYP